MGAKKRAQNGGHAAGATPAIVALDRAKVTYTLHPYHHDPGMTSFGDEAVAALGLDPDRVFKTLVARVDSTRLVVGVVPVSRQMNLKALAAAVGGKKAAMADVAAAERSSGYVHGGISPLGQRTALDTVIDSCARDFETVFVSAGKRGLQVELAPADLASVVRGTFAGIAAITAP